MSYTIDGVAYDEFSAENQHIVDKLVNREVFCCMTEEVEYMLCRVFDYNDDGNPFTDDDYSELYRPYCDECESMDFEELIVGDMEDKDFENDVYDYDEDDNPINGFVCPYCKTVHRTADDARLCCGRATEVYKCRECGKIYNKDEYDNLNTIIPEIYEWWAVSSWFGEKLRERGQPVIDAWGKAYWGRTCTGQAISLDGCIIGIAKEMGILKGMPNDWSEWQ